jgi:hypothetical protein
MSDQNNNGRDLEALTQVLAALKTLDASAQRRVIEAVTSFLGFGSRPVPQDFGGGLPSPASSDRRDISSSFSLDRTQSAKEFLGEKQPRTDVHRVVCLAYYLTHYRETPHFKTIDISKLNTEAAQPKFSNAAKAVDNAARLGYLVPAVKGSKQISSVGERLVQALPDVAAARQAVLASRPRKKPAKRAPQKKNGDSIDPSN